MGQQFNHLTLCERYQIQTLKQLQFSARGIGKELKRPHKTICNELARLKGQEYNAELAHQDYLQTKAAAKKFSKINNHVIDIVKKGLLDDFSPEQIAGRMKIEHPKHNISCQTIYCLVARKGWREHLARKGKKYRIRKGSEAGAKLIPNRVDIDERPATVDLKEEIGHWEGDTVYGQDGYLVTLTERVSKLLLTIRVKDKKKDTVKNAIVTMLKPFKKICKTITFDNGGEFAGHENIAKKLKCKIYFAKPYQSWQRGLNENTNGLLRRYCPKGRKLSEFTDKHIELIQYKINFRPRKSLNYLSPIEFLLGRRVSLMLEI